jgi:antirestriction protein
MAPVELQGLVQVMAPAHKSLGNSKIEQQEPGNMKFSIYQKTLDDMGVEIFQGDYIGYYETEDRVRYYVVSDDGFVKSDNKHTYGGYKPFYRSVIATYVSENEFRGI